MRLIITMILAVLMALNLTGVGTMFLEDTGGSEAAMSGNIIEEIDDTEDGDTAEAEKDNKDEAEEIQTAAGETAVSFREGVAYQDMEYDHYDASGFYADIAEMETLAEAGDADAVLALYDSVYDEFFHMDTLACLAYIQYCTDVTDEYWSAEMLYSDNLEMEMSDALCAAAQQILDSACGEAFAAYVGEDAAIEFASYQAMTERQAELHARETDLVDQYYALMNSEDDMTFSYLGETWTWDKLNSYQGEVLYYRSYSDYVEVYYGLMQAMNDLVGPVYMELVQIRAELAELAGYDSYADYMYELGYGRDYSTEDAQVLCDAVKEISREFAGSLYYSDLWYDYDAIAPVMDTEELLDVLARYVGEIDESLTEALNYMLTYGLYDIGTGDNRISGSYTTTLTEYNSPFLFLTLDGVYDVGNLAHEFGHFTDAYLNQDYDLLTDVGSYDLFEIHSNGLELLFTAYYDEIFTEGAEVAEFLELGSMLMCVIQGCLYDEFQREVYANPDMTLDQVNRLFCALQETYGFYSLKDVDYTWMYVPHNYESPLYYISYAVSALAALQIWDAAQEDFQAGVDIYLSILQKGAYGDGYLTVLEDCGLTVFTEEGAVPSILEPVLTRMDQLDKAA